MFGGEGGNEIDGRSFQEKQRDACASIVNPIIAKKNEEMRVLMLAHQQELTTLRNQHATEMQTARDAHAQEVEELRDSHTESEHEAHWRLVHEHNRTRMGAREGFVKELHDLYARILANNTVDSVALLDREEVRKEILKTHDKYEDNSQLVICIGDEVIGMHTPELEQKMVDAGSPYLVFSWSQKELLHRGLIKEEVSV